MLPSPPIVLRFTFAIIDRVWAVTRPRLDRVIYTDGSLGDELMKIPTFEVEAAVRARLALVHIQ